MLGLFMGALRWIYVLDPPRGLQVLRGEVCGYQRRADRHFRALKQQLDAGAVGRMKAPALFPEPPERIQKVDPPIMDSSTPMV